MRNASSVEFKDKITTRVVITYSAKVFTPYLPPSFACFLLKHLSSSSVPNNTVRTTKNYPKCMCYQETINSYVRIHVRQIITVAWVYCDTNITKICIGWDIMCVACISTSFSPMLKNVYMLMHNWNINETFMKACKERLFGFSRKMFFHLSSFSTSHITIKWDEKLLNKWASFNYIKTVIGLRKMIIFIIIN